MTTFHRYERIDNSKTRASDSQYITDNVIAPDSWSNPKNHFVEAIDSEWYKTIGKLSSEITFLTYEFYRKEGMMSSLLPVTCGSVSSPMGLGSDSLPVQVDLFGTPTYLADSMQFHLEYALRQGTKGVFYLMPTFRGEDHDSRHLNQFFHSEAEIVGGLNDVMFLIERYVRFLCKGLLSAHKSEMLAVTGDISHIEDLINNKIPSITFKEAKALLNDNPSFFSELPGGFKTISSKGERHLMKHFNGPVWLTHLPKMTVPFYQAVDKNDSEYALCADLLMGIGETVGCGERHLNEKEALAELRSHEVEASEYEWYLRMKREYPLKTSGFGLGVERFLLWLLKHEEIRDTHIISRLKGIESAP